MTASSDGTWDRSQSSVARMRGSDGRLMLCTVLVDDDGNPERVSGQAKHLPIDVNAIGPTVIIPAGPAGTQIVVLQYLMVCGKATEMTAQWQDGAGIPLKMSGPLTIGGKGGGGCCPYSKIGWFTAGVNESVDLLLGSADQVSGHVSYVYSS